MAERVSRDVDETGILPTPTFALCWPQRQLCSMSLLLHTVNGTGYETKSVCSKTSLWWPVTSSSQSWGDLHLTPLYDKLCLNWFKQTGVSVTYTWPELPCLRTEGIYCWIMHRWHRVWKWKSMTTSWKTDSTCIWDKADINRREGHCVRLTDQL